MRIHLCHCIAVTTIAFVVENSAQAQLYKSQMADPKKCRVVVEEMGRVGYRISDAQQLAQIVLTHLRNRMGQDAVMYEGSMRSAKAMKKMLGPNSETEIQDEQLAYYQAALENAPFRVRVRFGKKAKMHWVKLSCRNAKAASGQMLDEKKIEAKKFRDALRETDELMPNFCLLIDPRPKKKVLEPKRKKKEWALPPRR